MPGFSPALGGEGGWEAFRAGEAGTWVLCGAVELVGHSEGEGDGAACPDAWVLPPNPTPPHLPHSRASPGHRGSRALGFPIV